MSTNHQMNYYDYAKTLSAEGVMTALIGRGAGPEPEQHEYVDLGLPSGTLWATCDIGANSPEEAGLYFAWGETSGYTAEQVGTDKNFTWEDYQLGNTNAPIDENNNLKPEYDAATANWGDGWRMPTKAEFEELMTLPHKWDSSRRGYSFTDANENELLFVFAGGYASGGNVYALSVGGHCRSGSFCHADVNGAWTLHFNSVRYIIDYGSCFIGYAVRPVRSQNL